MNDQGRLYRIPNREAMAIPRVAAIDIGSNTFRLLIGAVEHGRVIPQAKELHTVRLGEGLQQTGLINDQALQRASETLLAFRKILDRYQPGTLRACGTAALRIAGNRERFLAEARALLGVEVEVIDGREEALLSTAGAIAAMKDPGSGALLLADVGGGSSELTIVRLAPASPGSGAPTPEIVETYSLPIGAVTLTETFLHASPTTAEELQALGAHVAGTLAPILAPMAKARRLVACGGTATALAALDCGMTVYDGDRIQDYPLARTRLDALLAKLSPLAPARRNHLPGLGQGRGEIVIGGLMILRTLLTELDINTLTVSDGGLLEGIALSAAG